MALEKRIDEVFGRAVKLTLQYTVDNAIRQDPADCWYLNEYIQYYKGNGSAPSHSLCEHTNKRVSKFLTTPKELVIGKRVLCFFGTLGGIVGLSSSAMTMLDVGYAPAALYALSSVLFVGAGVLTDSGIYKDADYLIQQIDQSPSIIVSHLEHSKSYMLKELIRQGRLSREDPTIMR